MARKKHNQSSPSNGIEIDLDDAADATEAAATERAFEQEHAGDQAPDETDDIEQVLETLQRERDEALAARQRALADYANYQKRAGDNEARARKDGQYAIIHALLPVLDHFDLALNQDPEQTTIEQMIGGVRIVQQEFMRVLETFGIRRIQPKPGDEFDPQAHEAMLRQPADGVPPNHVVAVFQPGFAAGDRVIRPAKVSVAPDDDDDSNGSHASDAE